MFCHGLKSCQIPRVPFTPCGCILWTCSLRRTVLCVVRNPLARPCAKPARMPCRIVRRAPVPVVVCRGSAAGAAPPASVKNRPMMPRSHCTTSCFRSMPWCMRSSIAISSPWRTFLVRRWRCAAVPAGPSAQPWPGLRQSRAAGKSQCAGAASAPCVCAHARQSDRGLTRLPAHTGRPHLRCRRNAAPASGNGRRQQ